ncbi:MAG: M15 family metallopeptidase [Clostridiales bacterium]|nr:M15 family metallopeptidase [Clostridiales bacterium]
MRKGINLLAIVILLFFLIALIWGVDSLIRAIRKPKPEDNGMLNASNETTVSETEITTITMETTETEISSIIEQSGEQDYDIIQLSKTDISSGQLLLVNNSNKFTKDISDELISFRDKKNETYRLKSYELLSRKEIIDSLNSMFSDFYNYSSLKNILIISTYIAQQENDMSTAYTINIRILNDDGTNLPFTGEGEYSWVIDNCHKYGFVIRYPTGKSSITGLDDPSFLRYVGVPHSIIIKQNNFCLEEYIDFIKEYSYDKPLYYDNYKIYYMKSTGDKTDVKVPKDSEYYVSGNNVDGFIITIGNIN